MFVFLHIIFLICICEIYSEISDLEKEDFYKQVYYTTHLFLIN